MDYQLHQGDCLEILKTLETNSVDSIVTDPPAAISFMGQKWDSDKGGRDNWIAWLAEIMHEALRVLKPGGHALVWALPRTSHYTATAIEDAGFEVRDIIHHLFSSGMPKSHDVSKAIDKQAGAERPVIGQGYHGQRRNTYNRDYKEHYAITTAATEDAATWAGWGTALKPAAEHWILARKPIDAPTIAQNVLQHGTGALNIDAARIGSEERYNPPAHNRPGGNSLHMSVAGMPTDAEGRQAVGRWPANLVLTCSEDADSPDRLIDQQSGYSKSKRNQRGQVKIFDKERYGVPDSGWRGESTERGFDDEGGASRFFMRFIYCSKVSPSERKISVPDNRMQLRSDLTEEQRDYVISELKRLKVSPLPNQDDVEDHFPKTE